MENLAMQRTNALTLTGFAMALAVGAAFLADSRVSAQNAAKQAGTKARPGQAAHRHDREPPPPTKAVSVLVPTEGHDVQGTIVLEQRRGHVHLTGEVTGLTPGLHGFHIHEFGDVTSPDGESAGAHYDPHGHKHGGPDDKERHAGDLGNIEADQDGRAMVDVKADGLRLHFVIGRSLVVHADPDDFESQPSGEAGARVAVGVIGIANDKKSAATGSRAASGS
jgi:Cu-Zn family superoxide dismutase